MTAIELIEILQELDPETEVHVQHTASDYWKTTLSSPVSGGEYGRIEYSSYHNQHKVFDEEQDEPESEGLEEVFLLSIDQHY